MQKLHKTDQSLLIVNTKKQARKLYEKLKETVGNDGIFHLSTYMCPANRFEKLDEIKKRISPPHKDKCIVVSTSLIEAGVDVDFPVVYRAVCGLDSIIQAAGRCNRERREDVAYTYVFDFADADYKVSRSTPFGNYLSQRQSITELVARKYDDVTSPEAVKAYFDMLFRAGQHFTGIGSNGRIKTGFGGQICAFIDKQAHHQRRRIYNTGKRFGGNDR